MKTKAIITILFLLAMVGQTGVAVGESLLVPEQYSTIQEAINAAYDGDTVLIADGIYTGDGNRDIDFLGKAITVCSQNGTENCIIDCNGTEDDPHRGFYFHSNEDTDSVISGFTIIGGYAQNEDIGEEFPLSAGGAIFCGSASPTISKCILKNNRACRGGGMCIFESSPVILECTIAHNSTDIQTFHSGNVTITYSGVGGGLYLGSSGGLIGDCSIYSDCAYGANAGGAGIYCYYSEPVFENCVISHNRNEMAGDGTGMVSNHSSPTLENCLFKDNDADDQGGGLLNTNDSNTILRNCLFTGNSASGGGAIRCWMNSYLTLYNCTINNNNATYVGGIRVDSSSFVNMTNCILWANTNLFYSGEDSQIHGGILTINYSNIQDWSGAHGGISNSGANPSITIDGHLSINSPCIDQGDPAYAPILLETDIDGEPRITNDRIDVGADEFNFTPVADISERYFVFSAIQGGSNPDTQNLYITNAGIGQMDWQISGDCNWLDVSPRAGSSTGETHQVLLNCDISYLTPGLYVCELTVTTDAINSIQTVQIHLNIYDADVLYVTAEFPTIQSAIDWAWDGAVIIIADGIYVGEGNRDIDFKGKAITVRSENGPYNCIIDCENSGWGFHFYSGEDQNSILDGLTITNAYNGISCRGSSPSIYNCIVCNCFNGGISFVDNSCPTLSKCIITNNMGSYGGGITCLNSNSTINNCFVTGNIGGDISCGMYCRDSVLTISNCIINGNINFGILCIDTSLTVNNCILWGNTSGQNLKCYNDSDISVKYSNVEGSWPGLGNIDCDPCFVDANNGDYHLKSEGWRWDSNRKVWTWDDVTSPCIDAGNPGSPFGDELLTIPVDPENQWGINKRINMGAYGGTEEASMPPYDWALLADLNNDGIVNFGDFAHFSNYWLTYGSELPSDLDRNSSTNSYDLHLFIEDWLQTTSWCELL
jgi:hypothetical protein